MTVLVLVGSNRAESFNARLAEVAVGDLPADSVSTFDLGTLPFYSEDLDAHDELGRAVADFRAAVAAADAIVLAAPAYNGTMSALAKNAIDTASRPRGEAPIEGKPVLVLSAVYSPGAGDRVLEHASTALTIAGARPLSQGFTVAPHFSAFDESGLVDKDRERELRGLVADLLAPVTV